MMALDNSVPTITILYSCSYCKVDDLEVVVRERAEAEDIIEWMHLVVTPALARHHYEWSNGLCRTKRLKDVKIPIQEGKPVGQAKRH